jgi:phenylpropionate dioxygenase-like ring-hydroxylating dioxygenase large terminal subunit
MTVRADHLVHNSVYKCDELYDAEIREIFGRAWNFACHESECRAPGDYIPFRVAGNPVVVMRGKDGELRAFYNVCRHRGSLVVETAGHCSGMLRCPYHWWTYDLEGRLTGMPDKAAYEATGFPTEEFGLVPLRVQTVLGLVFVCLDPEAPSLEDFLGERVLEVLERPLAHTEVEIAERKTFQVDANWKLVAENARDAYHVPFVHPLFRSASPPKPYELLSTGHALQWTALDPDRLPGELGQITGHTLPGLEPGEGYFIFLFPDLILQARDNFFMISSAVSESRTSTIVDRRIFGVPGDDEETRATRLAAAAALALDSYEFEDAPVLNAQSLGLDNTAVPYSVLARGHDAVTGLRGDDNRLRQWWAEWRRYLGVERNEAPSAAGGRVPVTTAVGVARGLDRPASSTSLSGQS